jgi:hypothetical protein
MCNIFLVPGPSYDGKFNNKDQWGTRGSIPP